MKEFQTINPDLGFILSYLRKNELPTEDENFINSKAGKKYCVNKEICFLDTAGNLRNTPSNEKPSRLVPINWLMKCYSYVMRFQQWDTKEFPEHIYVSDKSSTG